MLAIRLAKIVCVGAVAFHVALVAFNNVTDYGTNFAAVADVLAMDQVEASSNIRWRAVTSPILHHAGYNLIIFTEIIVALLCAASAFGMARRLRAKAHAFRAAKAKAILGLAIGILLYEGGFVAVGGEWFAMWQADTFDAVQSAFRITVTMLGVLIFVALEDGDPA